MKKYFADWWEMYYLGGMKKESVKISASVLKKIRKHVKYTGQTISAYIDIALDAAIKKDTLPHEKVIVPDWVKENNKKFS